MSTVANTWLCHSLDELAQIIKEYVKTGEIDYSKLAPSFPSGGIIINKDDLSAIYKTGKGRVILRGKVECDGNYIYITELPYQVYVEPFIEQVKNLIIKDELTGISNILNKSNKKSMLIEIECEKSAATVLNQLYSKTDLQKSYSANQYALVGKTPKLLNFKEYIDIYLQHNYDCIKKEYEFELQKSAKRLEIVEGLVKALEDIDNIIALIKKSESTSNAIENLMARYQFTQNQAKAIVDMKLGKLARLEKIELNQEREGLLVTIENCNKIINSTEEQIKVYLERFNNFTKKYPNPRKTSLTQINLNLTKEEKEIENVEPEKCVVIMTEKGNIKRIPATSFRQQRRNGKGIRTQDDITSAIIRTNTVDALMILTDKGKAYRLLVNDIPEGTNLTKGQPIKSLVELESDEQPKVIYSIYRDTDAKYILFTTKNGIVKKTPLEQYNSIKKKAGVSAIALREGDSLVSVNLVKDEPVILVTQKGYMIKFQSLAVAPSARNTQGVKGINLGKGDSVVAALPVRDPQDSLAVFLDRGTGKKIAPSEIPIQNRGGKGIICVKTEDNVAAATLVSNEDTILICGNHSSICIKGEEIPVMGRAALGNQMIKDNKILSVSKV